MISGTIFRNSSAFKENTIMLKSEGDSTESPSLTKILHAIMCRMH